jgi:hypothetical protein
MGPEINRTTQHRWPMETIKATFDGHVFVPNVPVSLAPGQEVEVRVPVANGNSKESATKQASSQKGLLLELAELAQKYPADDGLPSDYAAQIDHYLYGTEKRP